jgi:hypothetical protein
MSIEGVKTNPPARGGCQSGTPDRAPAPKSQGGGALGRLCLAEVRAARGRRVERFVLTPPAA